jgi:hypothetical protein
MQSGPAFCGEPKNRTIEGRPAFGDNPIRTSLRDRMKRLVSVAAFTAMSIFGLMAASTDAIADIITFTIDQSNCCGSGPFATVRLEDTGADEVDVLVTLIDPPASGFVNSGLTSFVFNNSVALDGSDVSQLTAGFIWTTSINGDGAGTFDYGFDCPGCGSGGSNPLPGPLHFVLSAPGLGTETFTANASDNFFGVDICYLRTENGCSATGMTWTSELPPPDPCTAGTPNCGDTNVPEPSPLALLAGGAIVLAITRRRLHARA